MNFTDRTEASNETLEKEHLKCGEKRDSWFHKKNEESNTAGIQPATNIMHSWNYTSHGRITVYLRKLLSAVFFEVLHSLP